MRSILITHLYFGDPDEEFSIKLAKTLVDAGVDILEIGIPYNDPVCDGEVFQRVCKRALLRGITPFTVLKGIKRLSQEGIKIPIYLTSYYAPIFKIGIKKFVESARNFGVNGLIVPDILLEEKQELQNYCKESNLSLIQFATVYSSVERLKQIVRENSDFVYCISLPGVTGDVHPGGARFGHPRGGLMHSPGVDLVKLPGLLRLLKSITNQKIMVGFGIKSKKDVKQIIKMGADGVIVGSAIARIYEKNIEKPQKSLPEIATFIKSLKKSTIY